MIVIESDRFKSLKGFCFISCQTTYVVINTFLADAVKQIVAAHELAHIVLHRNQLKIAPMKDTVLYDMASQTEYEANLFAADLLLDDEEIHKLSQDEDMDYFNMCKSLYLFQYVQVTLCHAGFYELQVIQPDPARSCL